MKNGFLLLLLSSLLLGLPACDSTPATIAEKYLSITGPTMGTTYNITYSDTLERDLQKGIDALLLQINMEVSTYIDSSVISQFNQSAAPFPLEANLYASVFKPTNDHHFRYNYGLATQVYKSTNGAFDPTVMPLVNYWGFGYTEKKAVSQVDSVAIDSLMNFVGFEKIKYEKKGGVHQLVKTNPQVQLDFSALAKGYAVDEVGKYLSNKGIKNYLVEIGGEVVCRGKNSKGQWWTLGINKPKEGASLSDIFSKVSVQDRALATSGNYRNYYRVGETSYAHTINPQTGFPEKSTLLSVTILAESCILADAYATAFMVMGREKAMALANELEYLEAYFIYSGAQGELLTAASSGMSAYLK